MGLKVDGMYPNPCGWYLIPHGLGYKANPVRYILQGMYPKVDGMYPNRCGWYLIPRGLGYKANPVGYMLSQAAIILFRAVFSEIKGFYLF